MLKFGSNSSGVENFGGDLKRLDLTWSGQVDLMAATPRSSAAPEQQLLTDAFQTDTRNRPTVKC